MRRGRCREAAKHAALFQGRRGHSVEIQKVQKCNFQGPEFGLRKACETESTVYTLSCYHKDEGIKFDASNE